MKELDFYAKCPDCFGDGKETCHNPDHGFLSGIMSIKGANESACPCCGHSDDHKMTKWNNDLGKYEYNTCPTCNGSGGVSKVTYEEYLNEYVENDDIEELNEYCLEH